jgi:ornithine decarboxylase
MSLDAVRFQYRTLAQGLGRAHIHYAVKANPHPEVLQHAVR